MRYFPSTKWYYTDTRTKNTNAIRLLTSCSQLHTHVFTILSSNSIFICFSSNRIHLLCIQSDERKRHILFTFIKFTFFFLLLFYFQQSTTLIFSAFKYSFEILFELQENSNENDKKKLKIVANNKYKAKNIK